MRILGKFLGLNESPSVWIRRLEVWGIRRMREFNLVLLGNRCWRLIERVCCFIYWRPDIASMGGGCRMEVSV